MYIKVANGEAYDILIPSDYMIERLKQEKLIQPLDQDKITCMDDINDSIKIFLMIQIMNIQFLISGEV